AQSPGFRYCPAHQITQDEDNRLQHRLLGLAQRQTARPPRQPCELRRPGLSSAHCRSPAQSQRVPSHRLRASISGGCRARGGARRWGRVSGCHRPVSARPGPGARPLAGGVRARRAMALGSAWKQMSWLYYQYLLITALYMLEPWERTVFNSMLVSIIGMALYTAYVFMPQHIMAILHYFEIVQ
uniref:Uncharacterized protein n=2 Tax=Melopsittacus undulatus TaxID=13146 RepID=A0A8V5G2M4_MELUD